MGAGGGDRGQQMVDAFLFLKMSEILISRNVKAFVKEKTPQFGENVELEVNQITTPAHG